MRTVDSSAPYQERAAFLQESLARHRGCPGFRVEPVTDGQIGFTCDCEGSREGFFVRLLSAPLDFQLSYDLRRDHCASRLLVTRGNKKQRQEKARGEKRARALLCRFLTPDQRRELKRLGTFLVRGQDGNAYRVRKTRFQGVEQLNEEGATVQRFCIVTTDPEIPLYDEMLAQKLLLESDLDGFLATAHSYKVSPPPPPRQPSNGPRPKVPKIDPELLERLRIDLNLWDMDDTDIYFDHPGHVPRPLHRGHLSDAGQGFPDVLIADWVAHEDEGEAVYRVYTDPLLLGYVVRGEEVYPAFQLDGSDRMRIPPLPSGMSTADAIVQLITRVPAPRFRDIESLFDHFSLIDTAPVMALVNPQTPMEVVEVHRFRRRLFVAEHGGIPPELAYILPPSEFCGIMPMWTNGNRGVAFVNPRAISVWEL